MMARTINGNLMGAAARGSDEEYVRELSEEELRIVEKVRILRRLLGDKYADWRMTAPLAFSVLFEPALDAKISELTQEGECTCKPDAAQDCPVCRARRECA